MAKWDMSFYKKAKYHGGYMVPDYIILHHTAGHKAGDLKVLSGGTLKKVSIHFYVTKDGTIYPMVPINEVAYHAGVSRYAGKWSLNKNSIGIELENLGDERYPEAQLLALDELIKSIDAKLKRKLPILGHKEVAYPKGRKNDPGKTFPLGSYKQFRMYYVPLPTENPKSIPAPKKYVEVVNCKWLNVRRSPSTNSDVVNLVKVGEHLELVGKGNRLWHGVRTKSGVRGYVKKFYTRKVK